MRAAATSATAFETARRASIATLVAAILVASALLVATAGAHVDTKVKLPASRTTSTGNSITLQAYNGPTARNATASAEVRVCTSAHTPKDTAAVPSFFVLKLTSGTVLPILGKAAKTPALKLTPLGPKQCVSGWISYYVPKGTTVSALVYTYGKPISWSLH
jgi:Flp pilus assembly protein TadG